MKTAVVLSAVGALAAAASGIAQAEEFGRVISATPVIQQVTVPRQVCNVQQVAQPSGNGGAGAVLGAIIGGVLGNQVGHGMGRAAATGAGVIAGAAIGDNVSSNGYNSRAVQQCGTQMTYENRTTSYNVTYEYGGKQYSTQMANDPGPQIRLQLTPVGSSMAPAGIIESQGETYLPQNVAVSPVAVPDSTIGYPVYSQPHYSQPYYSQPVYAQPYYQPYYAPIGLSIGLGYGYGGGYRGNRHWR